MALQLTEVLVTIFTGYWNTFIVFLPKVIGALIILLIGTVLGTVIRGFLKNIITRYKLDEKLFLEKPFFKLSRVLSELAAWFIYLVFIQAAVDVLGVPALSLAVKQILILLPQIIEAVIVIIIGYIIAEFLKHQVEKMKIAYARVVSTASFFLVIYVSFVIALPIIGLRTTVLENLLLVLAGTLGLGIALALGLGLKDLVADEAKKYKKKAK